jgi:hypothetical protein
MMRYLLLALVVEKILQHIVVTVAFAYDWRAIGSTVVVNPEILMVAGAIVAFLFAVSFWGILRRARWGINLAIALALFDIGGEFVAQGNVAITVTVSFLVAIMLLVTALVYRRRRL